MEKKFEVRCNNCDWEGYENDDVGNYDVLGLTDGETGIQNVTMAVPAGVETLVTISIILTVASLLTTAYLIATMPSQPSMTARPRVRAISAHP
jgi:hypothetical protein